MMISTFLYLLLGVLLLLVQVSSAPFDVDLPFSYPIQEQAPFQVDFTIHKSCSAAQSATLQRAFSELRIVANSTINYIQVNETQDPLFLVYFGSGADKSIPLATYDIIANGDKTDLIFRCDDPDRQCALNKDWNGHWRGEKAKDETVICDLSFESRLWLDKICQQGVNNINSYWAIDLIHRSLHMPAIGQNITDNHSSSYNDILQLAQMKPKESVKNMKTLQVFAFEVVSRNSQRPQGCMAQMKGLQ